jgi:hypothetical protein
LGREINDPAEKENDSYRPEHNGNVVFHREQKKRKKEKDPLRSGTVEPCLRPREQLK